MTAVDDALDRLERALGLGGYLSDPDWAYVPADLATVRAALQQLREERREANDHSDMLDAKLEAAEAEVRRYREGLREIRRDCAQRWTMDKIDALLADSPDGANTEGGEA